MKNRKNFKVGESLDLQLRKKLHLLLSGLLFFFLAPTQIFANFSYAQETQLSIKLTNVTIANVLNEIERTTEFSIIYSSTDLNLSEKVDVSVEGKTADEILSKLFKNSDISYEVKEKHIILYKDEEKSLAKGTLSTQQNNEKKVSGIIVDGANEPIIGASIVEKGTTNGTLTDMDGAFTLNVSNSATLIVTYLGYSSKDVKIGANSDLGKITIDEDVQLLEEVVVVGYGVQKKSNLTGAVNSIKMDEAIGSRPVDDIQSALIGVSPGISVSGMTGDPGAKLDINIRGMTNISGSGPLILLDNVPVENMSMINPSDVESISILKDAASASIYGARAAYGVVLITSKQGAKNKKATFNYSTNLTFNTPSALPKKANPLQTVQAYKDFGYESYWDGRNVDRWLELLNEYNANPSLYPDGRAYDVDRYYSLKENDLWDDMMEDNGYGFSQSHNLSVNGGSDKINYRLSFGLTDLDGILYTDKDSYKRYNVASFVGADLTDWLNISLDASYADSNKSDPYGLNFNGYGVWSAAATYPSYHPIGGMELNDEYLLFTSPRNILNRAIPDKQKNKNTRLLGRFTLTPIKGLSIVGEYGFDKTDYNQRKYTKKETDFILGQEYSKTQNTSRSKLVRDEYERRHHTINFFGTYELSINKDHNFKVMAGFNQEKDVKQALNVSQEEMIIGSLPALGLANGVIETKEKHNEYAIRGAFGRFNYDYQGKYLVEMNGRYDGSSRFPKNDRFGFFPSFSAGWRLSEESFMSGTKDYLSNFKLRGSFGSIGNQAINDDYLYHQILNPVYKGEWVVDGQSVVTLGTPRMVRDGLTWEKAETTDVGLDLGLFSKVNVSFDYYVRRTKGMIGPASSLPNILGTVAPKANAANLETSGWELELSYNDKIGKVDVRGAFNISDDRTKIKKYKNDALSLAKIDERELGNREYYEGQRIGEIWGYESVRYYTIEDFVEGSLKTTAQGELTGGQLKPGIPYVEGTTPNPGDMMFKDYDDNGIINKGANTKNNPGDRRIIGNSSPRFRYGFSFGGAWNNFDLSVFFQGIGKRDYWLDGNMMFPFPTEWSTIYSNQLDYWTPENTDSYYPRIYKSGGVNTGTNRQAQTKFLADMSYIRLKNITLSYHIPQKLLRKVSLQSAKIFFSGDDLYTWDHLPRGLDPELSATLTQRGGGAVYPLMRKFSFGVNVTF